MKTKLASWGHLNFEHKRFNLVFLAGRQIEWESRTHKLRALAMSISPDLAQKITHLAEGWSAPGPGEGL